MHPHLLLARSSFVDYMRPFMAAGQGGSVTNLEDDPPENVYVFCDGYNDPWFQRRVRYLGSGMLDALTSSCRRFYRRSMAVSMAVSFTRLVCS